MYWISSTIPLGYAMDILSDWMFFGIVPAFGGSPLQIMAALLLLSLTSVYGAVLYYRRAL